MCDALMVARVQLTELDLSDNAFGPAGAESVKYLLKSPSAYTLEILKLNNDGLGIFGGRVRHHIYIARPGSRKKFYVGVGKSKFSNYF